MPNLRDIPGKSLVTRTTKRGLRVIAGAAGAGALAVGGLVAKRVLGGKGDGEDSGANADPIAQTPTAPPGAEGKAVPPADVKPKPAKPKPPKADRAKPAKADKPSAPKPKAASKPKAEAKPKPAAKPKPKAAPKPKPVPKAKPAAEPGNISGDKEPHHALSNPVADPDETEYPDPFEKREDPRDPADPDGAPFGEEPHSPTGAESTSEPPLSQDPEVPDGGKPPKRENLDD